jgi:hypothetical protein
MKKLKTIEEEPWPDDKVVLYSFFPLFDDRLELADVRKQTVIRLVKWLLETLNITPEEFLKQVKLDEPQE